MTASEGVEIVVWVCQDCFFYFDDGEIPEHMSLAVALAWEARIDRNIGSLEVHPGRSNKVCGHDLDIDHDQHAENCELKEFSWSVCDLCESSLGGSRHAITLFRSNS